MKSTSCCTALCGHLNLWKSLIDHKNFHVDGADNGEWTTLDFCARNRSYELVWFFADRGVGVGLEDKDAYNYLHTGALHEHLSLCKTLICKHNLDVGLVDDDGLKPVQFSARNGAYELGKHFADMGSDIDFKTNDAKNCLHSAVVYEYMNIYNILTDGYNFDIHLIDNDGNRNQLWKKHSPYCSVEWEFQSLKDN